MDLIIQLGELGLATRLRRLADTLQKDVTDIYAELGLDFRASWFLLLIAMRKHHITTATSLGNELGLSHQAISKTAKPLIQRGLVTESIDPADSRHRLLSLTRDGQDLCQHLDGVWEEIRLANRELLDETGGVFLGDLEHLEAALTKNSIAARIRQRLNLSEIDPVQIVDYRPTYKKHFRRLNEIWLDDQFAPEGRDRRLLDDPNGQIIRRGGAVIFALVEQAVAGTCALIKHRNGPWELAKMAVDPSFQHRGLGERLATDVIERARLSGADRLWLRTSPLLKPASRLYRRLGFSRVKRHPFTDTVYCRDTYPMVLNLDSSKEA